VGRTQHQRDFSLGEIRHEYLEAHDSENRAKSLQAARNVRPLPGGGFGRRPGTWRYIEVSMGNDFSVDEPKDIFYRPIRIEPVVGSEYQLILFKQGLQIYQNGVLDAEFYSMPWTSGVWVAPSRENIYIGSADHAVYVLNYNSETDTWSVGTMSYAALPGGHVAQPYYSLQTGITLTPSAYTGTGITVTASAGVFTTDYVGERIKFHDREIEITGYTSATQVTGDVISEIPPAFDLTVADASGFEVGEIIVGELDYFEGYVTAVNTGTNVLSVQTLKGFEGPDAATTEKLSGSQTTSSCTTVTPIGSPYASPKWKVPLISALFGYPRAGAVVNGRLCLGGVAKASGVAIVSSSRAPNDFETGLDDDDAIIRKFGSGDQAIQHIVDAGDLIFITDKGIWSVDGRDGAQINPNEFDPSYIDARGANEVTPVSFNDKVVFVNAGGDALLALVPIGNVYIKWGVTEFSTEGSHHVRNPSSICAPVKNSKEEDRALVFANNDGDAVAIYGNSQTEDIGFFPWCGAVEPVLPDTVIEHWAAPNSDAGQFLQFFSMSDAIWALVYRGYDANGLNGKVYLEKLDQDLCLDCVTEHTGGTSPALTEYTDFQSVSITQGDYFVGEYMDLAEATAAIAAGDVSETYQVGVRWLPRAFVWPKAFFEDRYHGVKDVRTIRVGITARDTVSYYNYRNNTRRDVLPYEAGDDLALPPRRKTGTKVFTVLGNREYPSIEIGQEYPGAWEILKVSPEVT
tara:strand:+ start:1770 stop:3995 length:2226 start_codon:yes stop_codon:yes gene_type:complete